MAYYLSLINKIKKYSFKSIAFLISFYSILSFGCIYQLYHIFELYLRFPTIVSTETVFSNGNNQLPALTICGEIDSAIKGLTINESFTKFNKREFIKQSIIYNDMILEQNITKYMTDSVLFSMNLRYHCYTFNSKMKSM